MKFGPKETKELNQFLKTGRNRKREFVADLVDDLEPGSLKDELLKDFDPSQETYEEYLQRKSLERPFNMADGGRIGFKDGPPGQKIDKPKSKSAIRKPFAPAIEKRIIELANNDKLGAEAISKILTKEFRGNFSRSPVGKRITALKAEGIIEDIPVKEKAASIAMRGDLYGQPPGEKYLKIREIRDVDRKAIDRSTGRLKFKIPENAKFKINFGNTAALQPDVISNIPKKFIGVQYFTTKKAAEKALAERKKLKLVGDEDPDPTKKKANKKKYDLVKEVSDNNIERILADFKKRQPLEQAHRLSLEQVKKTGQLYNVMNLGLDFDSPEFVQINNEAVKPFENKLKQLYAEQNKLYKQASNLKTIPKELQKQIEFNNKKISTVVDLAGGRVQGLQLDEFTLKPKVYGTNYANVLGFGLYDKPVKELTDVDRAGIGLIMQGQVNNEKRTAGKTAQKLFANAKLLKDVDKLAVNVPPSIGSTFFANPFFSPGILKEAFKQAPTPLGAALLNLGFGVDPRSSIDRASIAAEAAFAPALVQQAAKLGSVGQRIANLGLSPTMAMRAARIASPLGIASLGAEGLYQAGKFTKKRIGELQAMSPEQRQELRSEGARQAFDPFQAAGGGIAKLAGDRSGAMLESMNPDSQGLSGLLKRVKKG